MSEGKDAINLLKPMGEELLNLKLMGNMRAFRVKSANDIF